LKQKPVAGNFRSRSNHRKRREMVSPIQIPDNAPFTPEQRQWLGEFIGKLMAQPAALSVGPPVPVTVLFGSQTGTAEGLAKKLLKTLKKGNFEPNLQDMANYERERLPREKNLLIITSTYGDGEPPDLTWKPAMVRCAGSPRDACIASISRSRLCSCSWPESIDPHSLGSVIVRSLPPERNSLRRRGR
jgi:hypothetical protein